MNLLGYALTTVAIGVAAVFLVSPFLHQLPGMQAITVHKNIVGIRLDQNYRVTHHVGPNLLLTSKQKFCYSMRPMYSAIRLMVHPRTMIQLAYWFNTARF